MSDGVDLVGRTSTSDSDSDVDIFEFIASNQEDGFEHLQSHGLGLDQAEGLAVDSDASIAVGGSGDSGGVLLLAECLDLFLLCGTHLYIEVDILALLTLLIIYYLIFQYLYSHDTHSIMKLTQRGGDD